MVVWAIPHQEDSANSKLRLHSTIYTIPRRCFAVYPSPFERFKHVSMGENGEIRSMIRCKLCGRWISRTPDKEKLETHLILEGFEPLPREVEKYFEKVEL